MPVSNPRLLGGLGIDPSQALAEAQAGYAMAQVVQFLVYILA